MDGHPPGDLPAADRAAGTVAPAAGIRPGRRLIAVMLLAAAAHCRPASEGCAGASSTSM